MTTWAELRTILRTDLQDTLSNPRWSDALLYIYLGDALADYSLWFPRRVDRYELTLDGTYYPLPDDFIDVLFVECPEDRYLEERMPRPGIRYPTRSGSPFFYYIQGGNLYLMGTPLGEDGVFLTYWAAHPTPADIATVMAATALTDAPQTITDGLTDPVEPTVVTITGHRAGATLTGNVVVTGTNAADAVITDTLALNGNDTIDGDPTKIFKTVTSVALPVKVTTGDTVSVGLVSDDLTIPERDEELIRLYIRAKVYDQMRSRQSALDRFKDRASAGSDRTDNPLLPEVNTIMEEYLRKVALRIGGQTVQLFRAGRVR